MNLRHLRHHGVMLAACFTLAACGGAPTAQLPTPDAAASTGQNSASTAALTATPGQSFTAAPAANDAQSSTLRIGTPFLDQPLDPASGGGFNALQFGVGETLMRLDTTFAPVPWLAENLAPDGELAWTLTLRAGLKFADGTPVTAEAVKASLERAVELVPTATGLFTGVQIAVKDERTLTFTTVAPTPRLPGILTEPSFAIVNAAAAQMQGDAFA